MHLYLGTRGSKLAMTQSQQVANAIQKATGATVELVIIQTKGDKVLNKPLAEIGGKGLFTAELEAALREKRIDFAVHSLKDMDSVETKGLIIQAYLERNDPRESFVSKKFKKLSEIKNGKIGSSSRRRELQLKLFNKNVKVESIRGNVDTRIKKVEAGEFDGVILALAGLKTLNLEKYVTETFSIKDFVPTAGQGIIAVQCREDDEDIRKILKKINHNKTEVCALAERSFLKTLGGDCDTAVGCSVILDKGKIELSAQLFSDDGQKVFNVVKLGKSNQPQLLGKIAGEEILKKSGNSFIKKR